MFFFLLSEFPLLLIGWCCHGIRCFNLLLLHYFGLDAGAEVFKEFVHHFSLEVAVWLVAAEALGRKNVFSVHPFFGLLGLQFLNTTSVNSGRLERILVFARLIFVGLREGGIDFLAFFNNCLQ